MAVGESLSFAICHFGTRMKGLAALLISSVPSEVTDIVLFGVFFLPGILPGDLGLEGVSPGLLLWPQRCPWVRGEIPSLGCSEVEKNFTQKAELTSQPFQI